MTAEQMKDFITTNARLGFCWQFITLAGFHADALVINTFAKDFARRGMLAYVERIQREEWNNGVDTLAHQKWSGANYYDRVLRTVQGGISSTAALGKGKFHILSSPTFQFIILVKCRGTFYKFLMVSLNRTNTTLAPIY